MKSVTHAAVAALATLAAACSASEEAGAPAVTADEQRALAEAREMIPPSEIAPAPSATPTSKETSTP